MYYTDITNKELQAFHPVQAHNFTVSLTQILSSPLFKVETIGDLYRIVPLFYTGRITSTNPEDKILDNKLIITNQNSDETYYTFISNDESEIVDYSEYGEYYEIGDTLTTSEFNAIISLLRQNTIHTDTIRINPVINGVYGVYEFDIEDCSFLDNGILISDETISAEPKVRLSNNLFHYSTYTLKLRVLHYSDVNILDDVPVSDFKVIETLEIELTPNSWIDIPLTDLEENYIILFDATVEITHDQPVIILPTTLEVTSDKDVIQTGDNATITATLLDQKDYPIPDETVTFTFLHGETTVETQTAVTDKDGVCSVSYTGKGTGELNIQVSRGLLSETYEVLDCLYVDIGTSSNHNDAKWSQWSNYPSTVTRETDSTLIVKSSEDTIGYHIFDFSSFTFSAIEFDLYVDSSVNNNVIFQVRNSGRSVRKQLALSNFSLTANQWVHFKLDFANEVISNDVNSHTVVLNNQDATRFYFAVQTNQDGLRYKNFVVY